MSTNHAMTLFSSQLKDFHTRLVLCLCGDAITLLQYTGAPCARIDATSMQLLFPSQSVAAATIYFVVCAASYYSRAAFISEWHLMSILWQACRYR